MMPAPKTPQPDHSEPWTATEAAQFIERNTMKGSSVEGAATIVVRDLIKLWEKHGKIRAGRHHNDTGTRINRRT